LDTHVFLWRLSGDPHLSKTAEAMIDDLANELFMSSASGFEIAAKAAAGKLKLPTDVRSFVESGMSANQIRPLPLTFEHVYHVPSLPMIHGDPFDRLLISAALSENLVMITDDVVVRRYPVPTAW
jgi:PIN domain nuclease of toxin-antitoxin system